MNSLQETRSYLKDKEFTECNVALRDKEKGIVASFYKKYTNKNGVKYIVNCNVYDFTDIAHRLEPWEYFQIEYSGQYKSLADEPFNMTFLAWNIGRVEEFLHDMWVTGLLGYWEKY